MMLTCVNSEEHYNIYIYHFFNDIKIQLIPICLINFQ